MTNFNDLAHLQAGQCNKLLGGYDGFYLPPKGGQTFPCTVIREKNVQVVTENGTSSEYRTVIGVPKGQVFDLDENGKFLLSNQEQWTIKEILEDDEFYMRVAVV